MPWPARTPTDTTHPLVHYDYVCDEGICKEGTGELPQLLFLATIIRLSLDSISFLITDE